MKQPFFITGLPRSRTSWLANLFTTGTQFCHHDLLARVGSLGEFERALVGGQADSDTGLIGIFPQVTELFPNSRWLLVLRNPDDCFKGILATTKGTDWEWPAKEAVASYDMQEHDGMVNRMLADARVRMVEFDDLDDFDTVLAAWRWLCPNKDFSYERYEMLRTMRVEPMFGKLEQKAAKEAKVFA